MNDGRFFQLPAEKRADFTAGKCDGFDTATERGDHPGDSHIAVACPVARVKRSECWP